MKFSNILFLKNKTFASFFLAILFASSVLTINPQTTHAIPVEVVADATPQSWGSWLQDTITAAGTSINASMLSAMNLKEWTLDGVAFFLAKRVATEMARSTVSWINSGFQGSPMFMTDPQAFMLNIADEAAGEVLYGSDLAFLCSPINLRISLNLAYQNSRNRKPVQCTLSGAVGNVDRFIQGNFMAGGWPAWLDINTSPINSTMGSGVFGSIQLQASISSSQGRAQTQANWGRGFLSREVCTGGAQQGPTQSGAPIEATPKKCRTVTPGDTIAQSLSFTVQGTERALLEADEINEIIGALLGQALKQGLTAARGLLTGSSNTYSSSRFDGSAGNSDLCNSLTYIEQINTEGCNPGYSSGGTVGYSGAGSIAVAISDEKTYQAIQRRIVNAADAIITKAKDEAAASEEDILEGEEVIVCTINDMVIKKAQDEKDIALSAIVASEKTVEELVVLQKKVDEGSEEEKLSSYTKFGTILSSGTLHTSITNSGIKFEVDQKIPTIEALASEIQPCPRRSRGNNDGGGGGD
ncbi:hypothetical protein K2X96_02615 [Patescibacteria group bacterium]|nr:hypothetical protein [Patescibacteria group bacterium]